MPVWECAGDLGLAGAASHIDGMWTKQHRERQFAFEHRRRYPTDLTDTEWDRIRSLLPKPARRGRKPKVDLREVLNAIRYMACSGGGWRMLPVHFGPWQTVYWWFRRLMRRLLFRTIHDIALMLDREQAGREASPSAGVLDSQTVKAPHAPGGGGYDAAKRTKGRKRHIAVDTDGRLLMVNLTAADVQDAAGALISFQRQDIVAALLDHLGRDRALAVERVGGRDAAFERQQVQQLRHRRDLVGLAIDRKLTQQQPLLRRPGMQHVQRRLARSPVEGAPQRLAVDGHHALQSLGKVLHEAREAGLERPWVKQPEHPAEGVVARNAVPQARELPQERRLDLAKQRHVREILAAGQHGAQRDQQ